MTAGNKGRAHKAKSAEMVKSRPFNQGVDDYRAGRWSEVTGTWHGKIGKVYLYEIGRLVAAATPGRAITAIDVQFAFLNGIIPSSTPRAGA